MQLYVYTYTHIYIETYINMYMSLYNNSPLAAANHNFTLKKKIVENFYAVEQPLVNCGYINSCLNAPSAVTI